MDLLIAIFEIIGTVAFSVSGAIVGIEADLDLFGVLALGIVTATGGGVLRDIVLGIIPPSAFVDSVYVRIAALTALFVFAIAYFKAGRTNALYTKGWKQVLLLMDSIGLAIFTVLGVTTAYSKYAEASFFLAVFCGLITGVGGGLMRDVFVNRLPDIYRRYIYAIASIVGGLLSAFLYESGHPAAAIWYGSLLILCLRLLAAHYRWSLPKVPKGEQADQ